MVKCRDHGSSYSIIQSIVEGAGLVVRRPELPVLTAANVSVSISRPSRPRIDQCPTARDRHETVERARFRNLLVPIGFVRVCEAVPVGVVVNIPAHVINAAASQLLLSVVPGVSDKSLAAVTVSEGVVHHVLRSE